MSETSSRALTPTFPQQGPPKRPPSAPQAPPKHLGAAPFHAPRLPKPPETSESPLKAPWGPGGCRCLRPSVPSVLCSVLSVTLISAVSVTPRVVRFT
ncbi:hypothetical protein E4U09_003050, partial [Claviceps aff. purpurea]